MTGLNVKPGGYIKGRVDKKMERNLRNVMPRADSLEKNYTNLFKGT